MTYGSTITQLRQLGGPHAEAVRQLTGINTAEHAEIILEEGLKYLVRFGKIHKPLADAMKESPYFWKWFRMQWYAHDPQFLHKYRHDKPGADVYAGFHRILMEQVAPDQTVEQLILSDIKTPKQ
jgi:hypothetical protein